MNGKIKGKILISMPSLTKGLRWTEEGKGIIKMAKDG